jgi:hypothetical protein
MTGYDEERIAGLLRLLPALPDSWVTAAQQLPRARAEIDEIVARSKGDAAFRAALVADLETALADAGYEATPSVVAAVRLRLGAD